MKPILIMLAVFCLTCAEVFAGGKTDLSFYKAGQLIESRAMTVEELKAFEKLEVSNQVMTIIDKQNGLSNEETMKIINQFVGSEGVEENLKQALNIISLSLEFDIGATGHESTTLGSYAEKHLEASKHFQNDLSENAKFSYDEIRVAGKKLF